MNSNTRILNRKGSSILLICSVFFFACFCFVDSANSETASPQKGVGAPMDQDHFSVGCESCQGDECVEAALSKAVKPIDAYRINLLELANSAASAMPLNPHIKTRSKLQEHVVKACLGIGQPVRALKFARDIENWRKGVAYADLAYYCAENSQCTLGQKNPASLIQSYLDRAEKIVKDYAQSENAQAWRSDRIRVRIAQTHLLLSNNKEAARFSKNLEESEAGKVGIAKAQMYDLDDKAFDEWMMELEAMITNGSLDQAMHAQETIAHLFNRCYENEGRRARTEGAILGSIRKVPRELGIRLLMKIAGFAIDHEDRAKALELVNEAQTRMNDAKWLAKHRVPLMADLAELRFNAGEKEEALAYAGEALELFNADREKIVDIFRAETLVPLAEAYFTMNDMSSAISVYKKAVEEGTLNPNSRPRAEDLIAICCSMAVLGVEPDEDLWNNMMQVFKDLGQPW